MSVMLPINPSFTTKGEKDVYEYIRDNLNDEYICYFNYIVGIKEFDLCIFVPDKGILIVEIKSWISENIIEIADNNCIVYETADGVKNLESPFKQARGYVFDFIKLTMDKIGRKIPILPVVWYTNISEKEFDEKDLRIISPRQLTLFKDNLEKDNSIEGKINIIFEIGLKSNNLNHLYFGKNEFLKLRELFETKEQIDKSIPMNRLIINSRERHIRKHYSILRCINYEPVMDLQLLSKELIDYWESGTKLIIMVNSSNIRELLEKNIKEKINKKSIGDRIKIKYSDEGKSFTTFNFAVYEIEHKFSNGFQILDGTLKEITYHKDKLEVIDKLCGFNLSQYEIEHCEINEDIEVRAGAGTGKTYTMVSRILFLIYKENLNALNIIESIFMITFTNESARAMKEKIKLDLINYFILTNDVNYFELVTAVDNMNISTIHSLSLKIIERYGPILGYGKDISIVTGKYERRLSLEKNLNNNILNSNKDDSVNLTQEDLISEFNLTMYTMRKLLESLIDKLENKNIDILNREIDLYDLKYKEFNFIIKDILIKSENELRNQLKSINSIKLSDIIIELNNLVGNFKDTDTSRINIKYLFVDEFQDTDNMQIELLKKFKTYFNYKLFIVGDIKQCIYRFRGAEEDAFEQIIGKDHEKWKNYNLSKNYRTDKLLLEKLEYYFNNWGLKKRLIYNNSKDKLIGNRTLNSFDVEEPFYKELILKGNDDEEFEVAIIKEIRTQLEGLENGKKIAILVRENWQSEKIINIGKKNGLYIDNDTGGSLYKIEPTLDFYKMVVALQNNKNPKYLLNLYDTNYIVEDINLKKLYEIKGNRDKIYNYVMENWPLKNWKTYMENLKKDTVIKVLRDIVNETKPWDNYAKTSSNKNTSLYYKRNLELLFEKLSIHAKTDYLTLNKIEHFLRIMITTNQKEETRSVEDGDDAAKIVCMTIHKAKGLEFNTVILPYTSLDLASSKKGGQFDFIIHENNEVNEPIKVGYKLFGNNYVGIKTNKYYYDEKEEEKEYRLREETRILYVALTRTEKNLVYFKYLNTKPNVECWQNFLI